MTGFVSTPRLLGTQTRYQLVTFGRIPAAVFFTLVLPLVLLVLVNTVFGGSTVDVDGSPWASDAFVTIGVASFTAATATYTNLANMVPIRRDEGVLKRWRGTPLPTWVYLGGFVASAVVIAAAGAAAMIGLGVAAYGVEVEVAKLPALLVTFLVGVVSFSAMGLAVASVIATARSASSTANATILPLALISNVFFPVDDGPGWVQVIGDAFPLKPFVDAMQACFDPAVAAPGFSPARLAVVAAWGIAGAFVALTRFRWEPSGAAPRRRRRAS